MNLKELIAILEEIREEHGDDVMVFAYEDDCTDPSPLVPPFFVHDGRLIL